MLPAGRGLARKWHETSQFQTVASAERWHPATGRFESLAPMATPRAWHASLLLGDGRVLVFGGMKSPGYDHLTRAVEAYNPATRRWHTLRPLTRAGTDTRAILLRDGSVLVVSLGNLPEIYNPPPP